MPVIGITYIQTVINFLHNILGFNQPNALPVLFIYLLSPFTKIIIVIDSEIEGKKEHNFSYRSGITRLQRAEIFLCDIRLELERKYSIVFSRKTFQNLRALCKRAL